MKPIKTNINNFEESLISLHASQFLYIEDKSSSARNSYSKYRLEFIKKEFHMPHYFKNKRLTFLNSFAWKCFVNNN